MYSYNITKPIASLNLLGMSEKHAAGEPPELCSAEIAPAIVRDSQFGGNTVSPSPYAGDEALAQAISKACRILGDDTRQPRYIRVSVKEKAV